jgi:hypothetical protein
MKLGTKPDPDTGISTIRNVILQIVTILLPADSGPANAPGGDIALALAQSSVVSGVRVPLDRENRCWARVAVSDTFDAWLISWPMGGAVDLHDHGGSAGAIVVVAGELTEVRPTQGGLTRRVLSVGAVHDVAHDAIHDVLNVGPSRALSVHVYSPPLSVMRFYDPVDLRPLRVTAVAPTEVSVPAATNDTGEWPQWTTAY